MDPSEEMEEEIWGEDEEALEEQMCQQACVEVDQVCPPEELQEVIQTFRPSRTSCPPGHLSVLDFEPVQANVLDDQQIDAPLNVANQLPERPDLQQVRRATPKPLREERGLTDLQAELETFKEALLTDLSTLSDREGDLRQTILESLEPFRI